MNSPEIPWRQPLLFQPVDTVAPFSFTTVAEEARAIWFPQIESEIEVRIASVTALASIWFHRMGFERHVMVFHPILNRPDVPIDVVRFIAKHELTHLVVRGPGHPPGFFEHELAVGPERFAVWSWVYENLAGPLRETRWGLAVLRSWRRRVRPAFTPYTPHLPFDDVPWQVLCPEGGAQLRFPPKWSQGSAPLVNAGRRSA